MADERRVDTVRLQRVRKAFWESAALVNAVELGLFTAISRGNDTIASAARQAVVNKVYEALVPGGEFHLIGEMFDADRAGPLAPALWGLSEAVSDSTGLAHAVTDCIGYLESAGFRSITAHEFIPETLTRVTGRKP